MSAPSPQSQRAYLRRYRETHMPEFVAYTKKYQAKGRGGGSSGSEWTDAEMKYVSERNDDGTYANTASEASVYLGRSVLAVERKRHRLNRAAEFAALLPAALAAPAGDGEDK